jgi:hypothetical protein
MSIAEWFNSEPVRKFRQDMLGDTKTSLCQTCYNDEKHNGNSRRWKSNQKSVIFLEKAFEQSFLQSPGYPAFEYSATHDYTTITEPVDIHVDFGNFCNLACKMCKAEASSVIAAQEVKWGVKSSQQYLGTDWTKDQKTWDSFKQQLISMPKLNNIHVMGGETLATNRFDDLVDSLLAAGRTDVCISFVTNGTMFRSELLKKLKNFRRVGIEVSIEAISKHNSYIRQGTDTELVLHNINRYIEITNNTTVTVALRPVPSFLSVGYLPELLQYALDRQFIVKSNFCYTPNFLNIKYLPISAKKSYLDKFTKWLESQSIVGNLGDSNASDPNNYRLVVKNIAETCISMLSSPDPHNIIENHKMLIDHCKRWDKVYNYNARELYPELREMFDEYGY